MSFDHPKRDDADREETTMSDAETNIEKLLLRAHEPPRIRPEARARILSVLMDRRDGIARKSEPARPPIVAPKRATPIRRPARARVRGALAALSLAALVVLWFAVGHAPSDALPIVHLNVGVSPVHVGLRDGTDVYLAPGAEVDELGPRLLRLVRGEAFLDVAHGAGSFVVESPQGRVVVLGTRFLIDARGAETRTSVARGEVRLEGAAGSETLHAGEEGILHAGARPTRTPAPRLSHLTSFARQVFEKDAPESRKDPVRRGTLVARDPQVEVGRRNQEWPLAIRDFGVDVHVENGVARTTIDQTFFNHVGRDLEGVYSFPLPPGASIARLAMYVDGKLVEGGVVERQKGRDVYESIVYQRRDPALLEWMAGNVFKIRIYPLPARSEKRVLLSYTQTLEHLYDTYRLEVPIPEVDVPAGHAHFNVKIVGGEAYDVQSSSHALSIATDGADKTARFEQDGYTLGDDLVLTLRERSTAPVAAVRHHDASGDYVMVRARPDLGSVVGEASRRPRRWAVLFDTSASRDALQLKAQSFFVEHLLGEWDDDDEFTLIAFDSAPRVQPGGRRRVRDASKADVSAFLRAESSAGIGDTDLDRALEAALDALHAEGDGDASVERVVLYVGDGMVTHGEARATELAKRLGGRAKFVGVAIGDRVDTRLLGGLANLTGGLSVALSTGDDLAWRAFDLVATLNTPRVTGLVASLRDAAGRPLEGAVAYASPQLAEGEHVEVLARLAGTEPARLSLEGTLDGKPWSTELPFAMAKSDARYLPRLWAQRRIDALLADDADAAKNQDEIVKLGLESFLLTPYTSLLVLENDQMYKDFHVRRPSDDDWARYAAPKTIPVKVEPAVDDRALVASGGAVVFRTPTVLFREYGVGGGGRFEGQDWDTGVSFADAERTSRERVRQRSQMLLGGSPTYTRSLPADAAWVGPFSPATAPVEDAFAQRFAMAKSAGESSAPRRRAFAAKKQGFLRGGVDVPSFSWGGMTGALHYSTDPHLDDLTEVAPAMFSDELDVTTERLARLTSDAAGTMTSEARALLLRANEARRPERFRLPDGAAFFVDERGHFEIDRVAPGGLQERTTYDGATLVASYPELALSVVRSIGSAEPLLLARTAPFVLPRESALGRGWDVDLAAPQTLRIRPSASGAAADESLLIELDDSLRVAAVTRMDDAGAVISKVRLERRDGEVVIVDSAGPRTKLAVDASPPVAIDLAAPDGFVRVAMPLRAPAHWLHGLSEAAQGTTAWLSAQRQLLATYAALGNEAELVRVLDAIRESTGVVTRGELALASRGVARAADRPALLRITRGLPVTDQVRAYVHAAWSLRKDGTTTELGRVASAHPRTLVGVLSSYRALLARVESGAPESELVAALRRFEIAAPSPLFRYLAAYKVSERLGDPKVIAAIWDELAKDPTIAFRADSAAAQMLRSRGAFAEAGARYGRAFEGALDAGQHPTLDPSFRYVLVAQRGEVGFRALWARWRGRVLASGDPRAVLSFVRALQSGGGDEGDLGRVLSSLTGKTVDDPELATVLVEQLLAAGRTADALGIVRPHVEPRRADRTPAFAAFLELASMIAERDGHFADAAGYEMRSMEAHGDEPFSLDALRAAYRREIDLYTRVVLATPTGAAADEAVRGALDAGARWRRDDPDNAEIDKLCAATMFAAGRAVEARRHLASIIERHPAEGSAYAEVAQALERQGLDGDADWVRAIEVEPTNPTWLLRRAQAVVASGRSESDSVARALLVRIDKGTWQSRFADVVAQARSWLNAK